MHTVSLSSLVPSKANPRRKFDAASIEGLAASIKEDGLLQNLIVRKEGKRHAIIAGERRYRALRLLQDRGEIGSDFEVPVEVRDELEPDEALRIATVENLQRANLAPLEETAALTKLVHGGALLEDVAAQTGLSATTIKRRLALNTLGKEAKAALRGGKITLAQAEALSLGSREAQERIVKAILRGCDYSAGEIKADLLDERPTVALAIFPLEKYSGPITTDLFAAVECSYFDDAEQFFTLQRAAVEELADSYREKAAWVEVTENYSIPDWQYAKARKNQKGGVLINLAPSGEVEVREGLAKSKIAKATSEELAEGSAPAKAAYAAPLRRYIAHHKTLAVQELLLASPRLAKEVAALSALVGFRPHEAVRSLAKEAEPQAAYRVMEAQARLYAGKLGFEIEDGESLWSQFPPKRLDDTERLGAIKRLSDHDLDGLLALLAALEFGQHDCERLDCAESLFNAVAKELHADMRNHWQPDAAFLSRRTQPQLVVIAEECGYAEGRSGLRSYKKSELVAGLARHFTDARAASAPTAAQQKAREWLPGVMRFPAIDPEPRTPQEDA